MVCGANLASHVHAFGPLCSCCLRWCSAHAQTGRVEFLVEASKAFLSSWFDLGPWVFSESLEMARLRPLTQQSLERAWCLSVSGRARSTSQLLMEVRLKTSHRNLSALCDFQATSLLELLLAAPCLVYRLTTDFGYLPQFVWILALC